MYNRILGCALIVLLGVTPSWAEEPSVAEAKTPEELEADKEAIGVSGTGTELRLRYDEVFSERAANLSLQEEISIDLIDLDELRDAIQSQVGDATLELSLGDCITVALRQNPDIIIAGFGPGLRRCAVSGPPGGSPWPAPGSPASPPRASGCRAEPGRSPRPRRTARCAPA